MNDSPGFRYPPPSHALTVWFAGNSLAVALPGTADSRGHTIFLPLEKLSIERGHGGSVLTSQLGWATLMGLLRERAAADARDSAPRPIGTPSSPSLWQIEQALSRARADRGAADKPRRTTLSDLGLD